MPDDSIAQLNETLSKASLTSNEVEAVVSSVLGGAQILEDRICYPEAGESCTLQLVFKKDQVDHFEEGKTPALGKTAQVLERLKSVAGSPGPRKIGQRALFARVPTNRYYRYRDLFQIIPVPKQAPQPPFAMALHALLLEYEFFDSDIVWIAASRRERAIETISLLLRPALKHFIGEQSRTTRHHWVAVRPDKQVKVDVSYCQEFYNYDGLGETKNDFTSIQGLSEMEGIPPDKYYDRSAIGLGDGLQLPSTLSDYLDKFFEAPEPVRNQFLRACYWFARAQDSRDDSFSMSYQAHVQAIEALVPDEVGGEICPACNKQKKGPTKRFHEFIERFGPPGSLEVVKEIRTYGTRSKVTHGRDLLYRDIHYKSFGSNPKFWKERWELEVVELIVRIALITWLKAQ